MINFILGGGKPAGGGKFALPSPSNFKTKTGRELKFCIWVDYRTIFQSFWFSVDDFIISDVIGRNNFWQYDIIFNDDVIFNVDIIF